jgi:hypothetical protein
LENLKGRDKLEDLYMDDRMILKCILRNRVGVCELDPPVPAYRPVVGPVNMVINLQDIQKERNFLICSKDSCLMELGKPNSVIQLTLNNKNVTVILMNEYKFERKTMNDTSIKRLRKLLF